MGEKGGRGGEPKGTGTDGNLHLLTIRCYGSGVTRSRRTAGQLMQMVRLMQRG